MIGMVLMGGALLWRVSKAGWVKGRRCWPW